MRTRLLILVTAVVVVIASVLVVTLLGGDSGTDPTTASPSAESTSEPGARPSAEAPDSGEPGVEAVVTNDPRASDAAMAVLADGGSAADAAVTAAAVLSVVEPYFSNIIGGETSALYVDGTSGEVSSLNAIGPVGSEYSRDAYLGRGATPFGLYQTIVPGAWDGWIRLLEEHGELGLDRILRPAVAAARDGHTATAELASQAAGSLSSGAMNAAAQTLYAPGGSPVAEGATIVQSDFAATLQTVVAAYRGAPDREQGLAAARDVVYAGEIADGILAATRADGGSFTADDLAGVESALEPAISVGYGGMRVHQNPPPSQALAMLTGLNILRTADVADDAAGLHLQVEAMKLGMADREAYVADPDVTDVPTRQLLSPAYGERQLERIGQDSAIDAPIPGGTVEDTTTFQVVDADGNAVTATTSTGYQFVTAGDTGIMMNNRLRYMNAVDASSPNFIEPGKVVRYTGNPYVITDGGELRYLGGSVGSDTQPQIQLQQVVGVLSLGRDPAAAVAAPRFDTKTSPTSIASHGTANEVQVESDMPQELLDGLASRGQNLSLEAAGSIGYATMIGLSADGRTARIGTDPRSVTSTGRSRPSGG